MKRHIDPLHAVFTALLVWLFSVPGVSAQNDDYDYVGTERAPNALKWGGVRWLTSEQNGFQGRPRMATDNDTNNYVTIAYDRFVSYYDLKHFAPCWVAYVTD